MRGIESILVQHCPSALHVRWLILKSWSSYWSAQYLEEKKSLLWFILKQFHMATAQMTRRCRK